MQHPPLPLHPILSLPLTTSHLSKHLIHCITHLATTYNHHPLPISFQHPSHFLLPISVCISIHKLTITQTSLYPHLCLSSTISIPPEQKSLQTIFTISTIPTAFPYPTQLPTLTTPILQLPSIPLVYCGLHYTTQHNCNCSINHLVLNHLKQTEHPTTQPTVPVSLACLPYTKTPAYYQANSHYLPTLITKHLIQPLPYLLVPDTQSSSL